MKTIISLMTSLTLITGLAACSGNAATDQQASPSISLAPLPLARLRQMAR